ncbi:hypothetical protein PUV44_18960 [Xanthomonas arboricola pv. corylina]|nr:hypothetical protein PUV44_18960 [Xanthomonas arboricola pv. corylina]
MTGTQADAELHEYAWRYKAFQKGWRIYAKPRASSSGIPVGGRHGK